MTESWAPLPPALRLALDRESTLFLESLPEFSFQEDFPDLPVCRVKAIPAGRLPAPGAPDGAGVYVPCVAYLVDSPEGLLVLDCGVERPPGPTVSEQLAEMGLRPHRLLCTHLHDDHCGGARGLGLALEASGPELEAFHAGAVGYRAELLEGLELRPYTLDPGRPLGPFPASARVADGVIAVDTSGHSPGSTSYLVCIGVSMAFICGDAVYPRLGDQRAPEFLSMLRIRRVAGGGGAGLVLGGHDTQALRACAGDAWLGTGTTDVELGLLRGYWRS